MAASGSNGSGRAKTRSSARRKRQTEIELRVPKNTCAGPRGGATRENRRASLEERRLSNGRVVVPVLTIAARSITNSGAASKRQLSGPWFHRRYRRMTNDLHIRARCGGYG